MKYIKNTTQKAEQMLRSYNHCKGKTYLAYITYANDYAIEIEGA